MLSLGSNIASLNALRRLSSTTGLSSGGFGDAQVLGGEIARGTRTADVNNDGISDIVTMGSYSLYVLLGNGTMSAALSPFSLRSQSESLLALDELRASREQLSLTTGELGAAQSRLTSVLSVLQLQSTQFDAAASRIVDADVAVESANLVKQQILQQAGTAVLGQANLTTQLALLLLS